MRRRIKQVGNQRKNNALLYQKHTEISQHIGRLAYQTWTAAQKIKYNGKYTQNSVQFIHRDQLDTAIHAAMSRQKSLGKKRKYAKHGKHGGLSLIWQEGIRENNRATNDASSLKQRMLPLVAHRT
jgi:hypothetical protein